MELYFSIIALIVMRLTPLFIVVPIASFRRVPITVRVIVVVALALPLAAAEKARVNLGGAFQFTWLMLITEFVIGASLAFAIHAAQGAVNAMGQLIDMQVGFAAGAVFDPSSEQMTSPIGELFTILFLLSFVLFDFHHSILLGFSLLLGLVPLGLVPSWSGGWLGILAGQFTVAFIITSPIIMTIWFVDIVTAFISRSLPQAQMYFVALPVKIFLGFILLAWFARHSAEPMHRMLESALASWGVMFKA